ncbi:MAG: hypothetical protein WCQ47_07030 [bacterium]
MIKKLALFTLFSLLSFNLFSDAAKKTFCEPGVQIVCGSVNTSQNVMGSLYYPAQRVFFKACVDEVSLNDIRGVSECKSDYAYEPGDGKNSKKMITSQDKDKDPIKEQVAPRSNGELFKMSPNSVAIDFNKQFEGKFVSKSCKHVLAVANAKESYRAKVWASHNNSKNGGALGCPDFGKEGRGYDQGVRQANRERKKEAKEEQARIDKIDKDVKDGKYDPKRKYYVVTKIKIGSYSPKTFEINDPKKQSEETIAVSTNKAYQVKLVPDKSQVEECAAFFPKETMLPTYITVTVPERDPKDGIEKESLRANIPILDQENLGEFCNNDFFETYEISMDREPGVDPKRYAAPVKYVVTSVGGRITNVDKVKFFDDRKNYTTFLSYDFLTDHTSDISSFTPLAPENIVGTFVWDKDKKISNIVSSKGTIANQGKI